MKDDETKKPLLEIREVRPEDAELCKKQGMCIHGYGEGCCPWPKDQCVHGRGINEFWRGGKPYRRSRQPNGSYWWVYKGTMEEQIQNALDESEGSDG